MNTHATFGGRIFIHSRANDGARGRARSIDAAVGEAHQRARANGVGESGDDRDRIGRRRGVRGVRADGREGVGKRVDVPRRCARDHVPRVHVRDTAKRAKWVHSVADLSGEARGMPGDEQGELRALAIHGGFGDDADVGVARRVRNHDG